MIRFTAWPAGGRLLEGEGQDGALIRVKYGDGPVSSITIGARCSEKDALHEAKSMIDGGGMD
jgi:hypothetical protein